MQGVDEAIAPSQVVDLDAAIANGKTAEAAKPAEQPKEESKQETPKAEEATKAEKQVLKKVEEQEPAEEKAGEQPANEAGQEQKTEVKEQAPKEMPTSYEKANPDEVVFEVNGEDVSATEIFHKYQDATEKLDAIEKDEWLKKFVDYRLKGGDPLAYLQTQTRDWAKVREIDLLRESFFESDAAQGLDDEAKEELFARELSEKYGSSIDGKYEDETTKVAKLGKQLMKRDADKVRTSKLELQQKFGLPTAVEKKPEQVFDPVKEREALLKNDEIKSFVENKMVRIGDTDYGHEVEDPEKVIGMMTDTRNFWRLFAKEGGGTDWDRLQKTMAFALDPSKYEATVLALGRNLGEEKYLKEKKNIKPPSEVNQDKGADTGGFNKKEFLAELKRQNPNW